MVKALDCCTLDTSVAGSNPGCYRYSHFRSIAILMRAYSPKYVYMDDLISTCKNLKFKVFGKNVKKHKCNTLFQALLNCDLEGLKIM